MEKETKNLIDRAIAVFTQTTAMKATYEGIRPAGKKDVGDGLVCITHQDHQWDFVVQTKKRMTRATVAVEKAQPALHQADRIIITRYVTPPIADLMKQMGLFFMDMAGNVYIEKLPLYVFIKGNKPPAQTSGCADQAPVQNCRFKGSVCTAE
jgi:hypothetical protein